VLANGQFVTFGFVAKLTVGILRQVSILR